MNGQPQASADTSLSARFAAVERDLEAFQDELEKAAAKLESEGRDARRLDALLRALMAILAVAAPALVTYSTRPDIGASYQILAIVLTGVAGAATTLQAVFGYRHIFLRNATTALNLRHLARDLDLDTAQTLKRRNDPDAPGEIRKALRDARSTYSEALLTRQRKIIEHYENEQQAA